VAGKRIARGRPLKKQEDLMRQTHEELEKEGWIRQFAANGPLAKDAAEIYDLLGYEVHLKPSNRSHSKKCNSSSKESEGQCGMVYIRPRKSQGEEEA
jgi:hypothetical protein